MLTTGEFARQMCQGPHWKAQPAETSDPDTVLPETPAPLANQSRCQGDALSIALEGLRQALAVDAPGIERVWGEEVAKGLLCIEYNLREHLAAAVAPDGLFAEVDQDRPTLARQTNEVCQHQSELLEQVISLRKKVQGAAQLFAAPTDPPMQRSTSSPPSSFRTVPDFGAIRHQAEELVSALELSEEAETKLILESVYTDIGVGD